MSEPRLTGEHADRLTRLMLGLPEAGAMRSGEEPRVADRTRLQMDGYAAGEDLQLDYLQAQVRHQAREEGVREIGGPSTDRSTGREGGSRQKGR